MTQQEQQALFNKLKTGETSIDKLLYPWEKLSNFKPEDLYVETLSCGFSSLDEFNLLKKKEGELIIIGGRPSHGKTSFMCQIARHVAKTSNVLFFSLEMGKKPLRNRFLAAQLDIPTTRIQSQQVNYTKMLKGIEILDKDNLYLMEGSYNVHQIAHWSREFKRVNGADLIVIDYLQRIGSMGGHSRDHEVGEISTHLQTLAKEISIPVIAGCQLNRGNVSRGNMDKDYRPMLSDLRESGRIEQDADIVVMLHRPERYPPYDRKGEVDIGILKNRNGPTGEVVMDFIDEQTRYIDRGFTL